MLADAHSDDRVLTVRQIPQLSDRVLLQDAVVVLVVVKWVGRLPRLTLLDPCGNVFGRFNDFVQLGQRVLGVADNGDMGELVLVQPLSSTCFRVLVHSS